MRVRPERCDGKAESHWRFTDQDRERVFALRTLYHDVRCLNKGCIELRLRLCEVRLGSHATFKPILRQLQRLGVRSDRVVQELFLRIGTADFEVVDRHLGVHTEPNVFEIRVAGLGLFPRGSNGTAYPPPEVNFIRQVNGRQKLSRSAICQNWREIGLICRCTK
jgi:hypothetical protein